MRDLDFESCGLRALDGLKRRERHFVHTVLSAAILGFWDGTRLAAIWWPVQEVMCIEKGKHLNSACGEILPYVPLSTADKTLTRQHRTVAHSDHGVQSRSAGCGAEAELHRACTSSSLISISPPPSSLGLSSGTTAGLSFASSSCRPLSRACPACLLAAVQIPALPYLATSPSLLSPPDDTSLHPRTFPISHSLLPLCN